MTSNVNTEYLKDAYKSHNQKIIVSNNCLQLWLTNYDSPIMTPPNYNSLIMTHQLWLTKYDSPIMTHQLWLTNYNSLIMTH